MKHPTPLVICLMGPTASGKTDIAIELVQELPCDIISVDSAMVYRGMDIGTAKPTADVLQKVPHRLINIRHPAEPYSAGQFCLDAKREISITAAQQRTPLLVGGTMLYFHALQRGLSALPTANSVMRTQLQQEAVAQGWLAMHARLASIDPEAARRIHPNDPQRIQRALEIFELTGKTMSQFHQTGVEKINEYEMVNIVIAPIDRAWLHQRIAARFSRMLEIGFVEEVDWLMQSGDLRAEMPAMRAVGYRQVWEFLMGTLTAEEMKNRGIIATRQLAKRQLTWLRSWPNTYWFDSQDLHLQKKILLLIKQKLQ